MHKLEQAFDALQKAKCRVTIGGLAVSAEDLSGADVLWISKNLPTQYPVALRVKEDFDGKYADRTIELGAVFAKEDMSDLGITSLSGGIEAGDRSQLVPKLPPGVAMKDCEWLIPRGPRGENMEFLAQFSNFPGSSDFLKGSGRLR